MSPWRIPRKLQKLCLEGCVSACIRSKHGSAGCGGPRWEGIQKASQEWHYHTASRHPESGKSKDSNRRSIQDNSWVQTATKLATSQEKQLPLCPLAPTLTSAFLLSLCFLRSFPSWIETFGRLISLHLFQLWCNCGNNSTTVGWKVTAISWFLSFLLLLYGYIQRWARTRVAQEEHSHGSGRSGAGVRPLHLSWPFSW